MLKRSDVVFMYDSSDEAYVAYKATFVAWGNARRAEDVERHHRLGVRCSGNMWCLTAGAQQLHEKASLMAATAVDIEGKPVEVPWLFDHVYKGTPSYFGCTNHPDFAAHCEAQARAAMAGGADGLHIDDPRSAGSALNCGGNFDDYCIDKFRDWLGDSSTPELLARAGVSNLSQFDYRDVVRRHARNREEFMKVRGEIPLMNLYERFLNESSAEMVARLAKAAAEQAGKPITVSVNAFNVDESFYPILRLPQVTHIVCETPCHANEGLDRISGAIAAFARADDIGKPLACTASGHDWAWVKAHDEIELPKFWAALAYAHGHLFMAPHPKRQWCFTKEMGTHWFAAPVEEYAPIYRFIRANARWFDPMEKTDASFIKAPQSVMVTCRRDGQGRMAIHLLNVSYDRSAKKFTPQTNVRVEIPENLLKRDAVAVAMTYDAPSVGLPARWNAGYASVTVPELKIWTVIVVE